MNKLTGSNVWLAALGIVALAAIIIVSITRDAFVNRPWREVSITGVGTVDYVPDIARITLGVHVENIGTAQGALSNLTETVNSVIPAITALGIAPEKIATQSLSLYPQYYYPTDAPGTISGYTADQQLIIEVPVIDSSDLVGKVIETANAHGANQVLGISFEASNIDELRKQAVIAGIEDARSEAKDLTRAAGIRLGKVVGWWENPISVPGDPIFMAQQGYGGGGMMEDRAMPTVPTGTSKVVIQVNVNYETK